MKYTFLSFLISLSTLSIFAQNFDHLMTKQQIDCSDISLNSSLLFVRFINENKTDSASSLLQYWESKCGLREPIFVQKFFLPYKRGSLTTHLYLREA